VGIVALTDWQRLDPLVALVVAANIVWTGVRIVRRSILGLMDTALSNEDTAAVRKVLAGYTTDGVQFHALRTRQAGARKFMSMHVLVPGQWTVQRGHKLLEDIEADIRHALPDAVVFTHLESLDDPASWEDQTLERGDAARPGRKPDRQREVLMRTEPWNAVFLIGFIVYVWIRHVFIAGAIFNGAAPHLSRTE